MKTKRIIIALALLAGIVAAGLCGICNSKESEFFNENLEALMDPEITVGKPCAYQPDCECYYTDAFGILIMCNGTFTK